MVLCVAHCVYVVKLSHSLSTIRYDPWKEISKIVPQVAPPWVVDTWPGGIVPVKRLLLFSVFMPLIAAQGQISEGKQCTTAIRYLHRYIPPVVEPWMTRASLALLSALWLFMTRRIPAILCNIPSTRLCGKCGKAPRYASVYFLFSVSNWFMWKRVWAI